MSSFAGVSIITDGKHCTTSPVDAGTDSGYHLLVVKDYSRTLQEMPTGEMIPTGPFMVGGHKWILWFYPNGSERCCADFISLYLFRVDGDEKEAVEAKYQFSFVDQLEYQKPMHIRAAETCRFSRYDPLEGCHDFVRRDALERSTNLKGDCFTVRCDIMVCRDHNTCDTDGGLSEIHEHFNSLLHNKVGADVTFEVNGKTFFAHRCVLAARSKVFMVKLFGPTREGTTSTVVQINDMDAEVFGALLSFIYTDSFPKTDKYNGMVEEEGQDDNLMWLQELLVAADKYDVQRLKFLCEERLIEHIGVSSVASALSLAEHHNCHKLKEVCFNFIKVQSPKCLDKVMATNGWDHMISMHPSVLNEFVAKLVFNQKKDKKRKH